MKSRLTLITDRKSASEGEYIDIKWSCDVCPDSLSLTIDSGYKCDTIAVADSGSTRIALSRSKGKTKIILKGIISGKRASETVDIRVKNRKTEKTSVPLKNRIQLWKEKIQARWYVFRAQIKYWWLSQKKWQKALWIALLILWLFLLIASFGKGSAPTASPEQLQTSYDILSARYGIATIEEGNPIFLLFSSLEASDSLLCCAFR